MLAMRRVRLWWWEPIVVVGSSLGWGFGSTLLGVGSVDV